jgi:hypothetical protein
MSISGAGNDIGWRNHSVSFYNKETKTMDVIKIDFSQQKNINTGFFEKIEYEERLIVQILNDYVDGMWEKYYSKMEAVFIEQQMYGTFNGKKIDGDKRYPLMSRILYSILEARGIPCYMVNQRTIRKDLGTQLLKHEQTGNANKDRKLRKKKSIAKLREIVGDDVFYTLKKQFGKMDDVADAFLMTMWGIEHIEELKAAKEKNARNFTWSKTKNGKKQKVGKRFIKATIELEPILNKTPKKKRVREEEIISPKKSKKRLREEIIID